MKTSLRLAVAVAWVATAPFIALLALNTAAADLQVRIAGDTDFATSMYQKLRSTNGNLLFSPHSISTALAMTWAGARSNTASQMADVLHFSDDSLALHEGFAELARRLTEIQKHGNIELAVANSLWPQKGYDFRPEYLALIAKFYAAYITPVDYRGAPDDACSTINRWVEKQTRTKIRNLITRNVVDQLTRLILVNAVYFKGRWAEPFSESATRPDKFFAGAGRELQVPFMNRSGDFRYGEDNTVQVLELPYAGGELSMVILLPKSRRGLVALEQKLRRENLQGWLQKLRPDEVRASLPKFRFECAFRLDDSLKALGMCDAFDPHRADFSGMDGRIHWLYISAALHKAFIEVNEEGTEAAAATGVVMHAASLRVPGPPVFRADHPFLFLIRERATGCILFLGRVVEPKVT